MNLTIEISALTRRGIEVLPRAGSKITLPRHCVVEAPASLKWTQFEHSLELGAFSYQVSGFCGAARIGRYCSFGEDVQIGRQNHPTDWISTSPAFYLGNRLFGADGGFAGDDGWRDYRPEFSRKPPTKVRVTTIGHDVWIGHGAMIRAGITVGTGAVIGAGAHAIKDVPPYAVVAGNPATIIRFRHPPDLVARLLRSEWWRHAPWQLAHLDPSTPGPFLRGLAEMKDTPPFAPDVVDLRTFAEARG